MSTWEVIAEKARELPADKQQEVLDFVEFLRRKKMSRRARRSALGLWSGIDISDEDIAEALGKGARTDGALCCRW